MASTTLETLLQDFAREYAGSISGRVGTATSGTTTTVVDAANFGGPFSVAEWTRGSPIRFTSAGNRAGQKSYLTSYDPATGTLTFSPAVTNAIQNGDKFIVVQKHIVDSLDRLIEAANRGLKRDAGRFLKTPITEIPGGDLMGGVADWTADSGSNAGSISYVDMATPDGMYQRFAQWVATTGAFPSGFTSAGAMQVQPGDVVDFSTFGRVVAGVTTRLPLGAATGWSITVVNESAVANLVPVYTQGSGTTPILSWTEMAGSVTIPAGCYAIRFHVFVNGGDLGSAGVQVGPVVACVRGKRIFTTQPPLDAIPKMIGEFYQRRATAQNEQPGFGAYRSVPLAVSIENQGWGFALDFSQTRTALPFPLYYEQYLSYPALVLDADTTACPEDLALAAMAFEFFRWAQGQNRQTAIARGRIFSFSPWDSQFADAKQALKIVQKAYGCEIKLIKRREYAGVASA